MLQGERRDQGEEQQLISCYQGEEQQLISCCSSPWSRKEFDWNGDVATRVDCVPQRLNSLRNIYAKG